MTRSREKQLNNRKKKKMTLVADKNEYQKQKHGKNKKKHQDEVSTIGNQPNSRREEQDFLLDLKRKQYCRL